MFCTEAILLHHMQYTLYLNDYCICLQRLLQSIPPASRFRASVCGRYWLYGNRTYRVDVCMNAVRLILSFVKFRKKVFQKELRPVQPRAPIRIRVTQTQNNTISLISDFESRIIWNSHSTVNTHTGASDSVTRSPNKTIHSLRVPQTFSLAYH